VPVRYQLFITFMLCCCL